VADSERRDERSGFGRQEPPQRDPHGGTEQVSSGQLSGRQAVGPGTDTGYSRGETGAGSGAQEGQMGGAPVDAPHVAPGTMGTRGVDDDLGLPEDAAYRPEYDQRGGLTGSSYREPGRDATENRRSDELDVSENPANPESANSDLNQPTDSPLAEATAGSPWPWQPRSAGN
jgi:hypothetical protein